MALQGLELLISWVHSLTICPLHYITFAIRLTLLKQGILMCYSLIQRCYSKIIFSGKNTRFLSKPESFTAGLGTTLDPVTPASKIHHRKASTVRNTKGCTPKTMHVLILKLTFLSLHLVVQKYPPSSEQTGSIGKISANLSES